jgi:hypothetical protein
VDIPFLRDERPPGARFLPQKFPPYEPADVGGQREQNHRQVPVNLAGFRLNPWDNPPPPVPPPAALPDRHAPLPRLNFIDRRQGGRFIDFEDNVGMLLGMFVPSQGR